MLNKFVLGLSDFIITVNFQLSTQIKKAVSTDNRKMIDYTIMVNHPAQLSQASIYIPSGNANWLKEFSLSIISLKPFFDMDLTFSQSHIKY